MIRSHGNLRFSANRNLTYFFVTYANILTSLITAPVLPVKLVSINERSPTPAHKCASRKFGDSFEPRLFSAQKHLTSELLRFL